MIVIFTFDFKNDRNRENKKNEYLMLVLSIQSLLDCNEDGVRVLVYTNDKLVKRNILLDFGGEVDIVWGSGKNEICDTSWFSCAGHGRLSLMKQYIEEDDVLYMDNDTVAHPDIFNQLKKINTPTMYRYEPWHGMKGWCKLHHKSHELYDYIESTGMIKTSKPPMVYNNGVVYLPKNKISKYYIKYANDIYNELKEKVGYSYGLDQTSMSLAFHNMNLYSFFFVNGTTNNTVWHVYIVKHRYRDNINNSIFYITDDMRMGFRFGDVYNTLNTNRKLEIGI